MCRQQQKHKNNTSLTVSAKIPNGDGDDADGSAHPGK
jgi:hypothetical protein